MPLVHEIMRLVNENAENGLSVKADLKRSLLPPHIDAIVDQDAAAILHSATMAVKTILARRAEMDRNGQKDIPLVVLAGESHATPAHQIHHMKLMDELMRAGEKIAVTKELPHTHDASPAEELLRTLPEKYVSSLPIAGHLEKIGVTKHDWKKLDIKGQFALMFSLAHDNGPGYANYSRFSHDYFLLNRNIPTAPVDTERTIVGKEIIIDHLDPSTAHSFQACIEPDQKPWAGLSAINPKGMHIRNHHMVKHGIQFARAEKARILISICGGDHVYGYGKEKTDICPSEESMVAEYARQSGWPVIGLILDGNLQQDQVPENIFTHRVSSVRVFNNLALHLRYCEVMQHPQFREMFQDAFGKLPNVLWHTTDEAEYTNRILDAVNLHDDVMTTEKQQGLKGIFYFHMMKIQTALQNRRMEAESNQMPERALQPA